MNRTGLAILMTSALTPNPLHAAEAAPASIDRCPWLNHDELRRLTALEFRSEAQERSSLQFSYRCTKNNVTIRLENTQTGVHAERLVEDVCCDKQAPERALALLAIGLYRSAQSILVPSASGLKPKDKTASTPSDNSPEKASGKPGSDTKKRRETKPVGSPPKPVVPPSQANRQPQAANKADAPAALLRHQLGITGRSRFHLPSSTPIVTGGVGLRYDVWPWNRIGFGGRTEALFGATQRVGGTVSTRVLTLGGLAHYRPIQTERFILTGTLGTGLAHVRLDGTSSDPTRAAASLSGLTAYAHLLATPAVRIEGIEIGLPVELGYLFRAPRGSVDGDGPVQLDGFNLSVGLAASIGWTTGKKSQQQTAQSRRSW